MTRARFLRACVILVSVTACRGSSAPTTSQSPLPASDWFVDRAADTGFDFTHFNGMSGAQYYAEHMGPGVALFDYDNDGDLDVFIPQGRMLGAGRKVEHALFPPKGPLKGRLFRNDLRGDAEGTRPSTLREPQGRSDTGRGTTSSGRSEPVEGRALRFTDVTEASGLNADGYGMGAATGDYNNDGCVDLYVTSLGRNQLFRNTCNGTFTDVSRVSRTDDTGWSTSAAFVDYDRDGWLDLLVAHYLAYSPEGNVQCYSVSGKPDYCPPHVYSAQPSHLFHNNRDGTFTDATVAAGISREFGPALGISTADFNGDGWVDIFVANDGQPNQLWINQHDGTFKNTGLLSGTALSAEGAAKSSMGVDAGDFDNDGDEDLFVAELTGQGADLYVNDGTATFTDQSARSRIRFETLPYTGFGAAWFDFDNDGWLDLLMVNGAVTGIEELVKQNDPFPLRQLKQVLRNRGDGTFEDVTNRAGAAFRAAGVGRGAAFGDLDNDGDADVVVANDNGRAELLVNEVGQRNHWVGIRAVRAAASKAPDALQDAVGARVAVARDDGRLVWRRTRADGSYLSANDPRALIGLGQSSRIARVRVVWPDGRSEEWSDVPIDRYTTLKEGTGR